MDRPGPNSSTIAPDRFDAVLFDLDGVVTATARVHAACWKRMFDEYLKGRAEAHGGPFRPFEIETDYLLHVDGKPRYDGVRDFLASRSITLPEGTTDDAPGEETVRGLGNRKDELVKQTIQEEGVEVYESSVTLLTRCRAQGMKTAVVTSSRNCLLVLAATGLTDLFDARVDGTVAAAEGLRGKPAPDTFLRAAELLGVEPARAVVFEDALSGVQAGRAGQFGLVVGVDRGDQAAELLRNGADFVVADLAELLD